MYQPYARYTMICEKTSDQKTDYSTIHFFSLHEAQMRMRNLCMELGCSKLGLSNEDCEKMILPRGAYLTDGKNTWRFTIVDAIPYDDEAFNRCLFTETKEMVEVCIMFLNEKYPLTSYEYTSASFMLRSMLGFFQDNGIIESFDSDAVFQYLCERHESFMAARRLEEAMADNPGSTVWKFTDTYAIRRLEDQSIIICGATRTQANDAPPYDVVAMLIPADSEAGIKSDDDAWKYLNQNHFRFGVYLGLKADLHEAMETVRSFTKGPWIPAHERRHK